MCLLFFVNYKAPIIYGPCWFLHTGIIAFVDVRLGRNNVINSGQSISERLNALGATVCVYVYIYVCVVLMVPTV